MNTLGSIEWKAMRPDAQAFDEVRITTVPRYKESGFSGDEWRISAKVELLHKGKVVHEAVYRDVETACGFLYAVYHNAIADGKAYLVGDGIHCDQEGCSELATVKYRKLLDYNRDGMFTVPHTAEFRYFCGRHKVRGDCGLDDADKNYEPVPYVNPRKSE